MKKWRVEFTATLQCEATVEAETEQEAWLKAEAVSAADCDILGEEIEIDDIQQEPDDSQLAFKVTP